MSVAFQPGDWNTALSGAAASAGQIGGKGKNLVFATRGGFEVFDKPTATAGEHGELGVRVHRNRERYGFEHWQVAGRVGVGNRLLQVEVVLGGVLAKCLGSHLADRRGVQHAAGVSAIVLLERWADDVVEERFEVLDNEVECTGDEHGSMARRTMHADPADGIGVRVFDEEVAEQFSSVAFELFDRCVVVTPIEVSQELDTVSAVKPLQADRFSEAFEDQSGSLCSIEVAGGEPTLGTNHVGVDQRVFEVKGSELTAFVEHLFAQPLGAAEGGALLARWSGLDSTLFQD